MGVSKSLYDLQRIDSDLQKTREALLQIERQLCENETLIRARDEASRCQSLLAAFQSDQRDVELEVEGLEAKIGEIKGKLYKGSVRNPKELVSLEQEQKIFEKQLAEREERLLNVMSKVDSAKAEARASSETLVEIERQWREQQEGLVKQKAELEERLAILMQERDSLVSQIELQAVRLYERVKVGKGHAVVRVEQGRCQGCRIDLTVSERQRIRSGSIVHCSNCGRILYLE